MVHMKINLEHFEFKAEDIKTEILEMDAEFFLKKFSQPVFLQAFYYVDTSLFPSPSPPFLKKLTKKLANLLTNLVKCFKIMTQRKDLLKCKVDL